MSTTATAFPSCPTTTFVCFPPSAVSHLAQEQRYHLGQVALLLHQHRLDLLVHVTTFERHNLLDLHQLCRVHKLVLGRHLLDLVHFVNLGRLNHLDLLLHL